jgi:hypothetical protein
LLGTWEIEKRGAFPPMHMELSSNTVLESIHSSVPLKWWMTSGHSRLQMGAAWSDMAGLAAWARVAVCKELTSATRTLRSLWKATGLIMALSEIVRRVKACVGVLAMGPNAGVTGYSETGTAVYRHTIGSHQIQNALARLFDDGVQINNALVGTQSKYAAVLFPDGTHQLLYAVESPKHGLKISDKRSSTQGKQPSPCGRLIPHPIMSFSRPTVIRWDFMWHSLRDVVFSVSRTEQRQKQFRIFVSNCCQASRGNKLTVCSSGSQTSAKTLRAEKSI